MLLSLLLAASVLEVEAVGVSRLKPEAVVQASGLKPGDTADQATIEGAANRLIATGYFRSVNFRWDPMSRAGKEGFRVRFDVIEDDAEVPIFFDIPGVTLEKVSKIDPMIGDRIPGNEQSIARVKAAVQKLYSGEVTQVNEGDLATRRVHVIFRARSNQKIGNMTFSGVQALGQGEMQRVMSKAMEGREFTDLEVRRALAYNIVPMYEGKGHLAVKFPEVMADPAGPGVVNVRVRVEEGPVFTLAKVEATGSQVDIPKAGFPIGKTASWYDVLKAIDNVHNSLRAEGYILSEIRPERILNGNQAELTLHIIRGSQMRFRKLVLTGLRPDQEDAARAMWKIKPGEPMNEPYVDDYIRTLFDRMGSIARGVSKDVRPASATEADVLISFR